MDFEAYSALHTRIFAENHLEKYVSRETIEVFWRLTERMLTVNAEMNLSAVRDAEGAVRLHYADSLLFADAIPEGSLVIDVGCGGGFPSLPLAIARPDLQILALDSTEKKVRYVAETAEILGLSNLKTVVGRAEELGHSESLRESADVVIARAVSDLPLLSELCIPLVRVGGRFLAMKGAKWEDEAARAGRAIETLGGRLSEPVTATLLGGLSPEVRCLLTVEKLRPTPNTYPRAWGRIKKKPL